MENQSTLLARLGNNFSVVRLLFNIAAGTAIGVSVSGILSLRTASSILIAAFFCGLLILTSSAFFALTSLALGFGLLCILIQSLSVIRGLPTITGGNLLVAYVLLTVVCASALRFLAKPRSFLTEAVGTLVVSTLGLILKTRLPTTPASAFQTLVSVGEDNAAWLQALARSSAGKGAVFQSSSLYGGDTGTGLSLTLFRQLVGRYGTNRLSGLTINSLVLLRGSLILSVMIALIVSSAVVRISLRSGALSRIVLGVSSGLLAYSLSTGLSAMGHYSALQATLLLSVVACLVSVKTVATDIPSLFVVVSAPLLVLGAGLSWFPLMPLAFVITTYGCVAAITHLSTTQFVRAHKFTSVSLGLVVAIGAAYWIRNVFSIFLDNFSWKYFSFNMGLNGGVQSTSSLVALPGFLALIYLSSHNFDWRRARIRSLFTFDGFSTYAFVSYVCAIYLLAFAVSPYSPRYGATKILYIAACVGSPLVPCALALAIGSRLNILFRGSIGPMALLALSLFDPSRMFFGWPASISLQSSWSPVVVQEIARRPQRHVVCLNTTTDLGQDISAYICSRMASGLQGLLNPDGSPDGYDFNIWTAANIYGISPEQGADAWDSDFYRSLTILVFDPTRRDNGDARQIAWLADVDWTAVRIIGPEGQVVKKAGVPLPQ